MSVSSVIRVMAAARESQQGRGKYREVENANIHCYTSGGVEGGGIGVIR